MSFPFHDPPWVDAAEAVVALARPGDTVLGPDLFWWYVPRLHRYRNTWIRPEERYDIVVVAKDRMDRINTEVLVDTVRRTRPVFANEVFVVLADRDPVDLVAAEHLPFFEQRLAELEAAPPAGDPSADPVLPDPGVIEQFAGFDGPTLHRNMEDFWRNGGYEYPTQRDHVYERELERVVSELLGPLDGQLLVDMCCGAGRHRPTGTKLHAAFDCAPSAVTLATARGGDLRGLVADAAAVPLRAAAADVVLLADSIEHVPSVERVFAEASRLLCPGGRFVLTAANTDSLNQRLTRALGYPEFVSNYQHVREFSFSDVVGLLDDHGFEVEDTRSLYLYPYWGVPGIDDQVQHAADEDPELVDALRVLGVRAGPEYAYTFGISSRKR